MRPAASVCTTCANQRAAAALAFCIAWLIVGFKNWVAAGLHTLVVYKVFYSRAVWCAVRNPSVMGCGSSTKSKDIIAPRPSNVQVRLTREQNGDVLLTPKGAALRSSHSTPSPNPLLGLESVLGYENESEEFDWDQAAASSCCIGSCFAVAHIGPGQPPIKSENQDVAICIDDFTGRPGMKLLGIFDGHGKLGKRAAEYEPNRLPRHMPRIFMLFSCFSQVLRCSYEGKAGRTDQPRPHA